MHTRQQKEQLVHELHEKFAAMNSAIAVDYRGLTVKEAQDLRRRCRAAGEGQIEYRVAKNTLLRRAVDGTSASALVEYLTGPTAVALSFDEPWALAKVLVDYAKENEKFEIKGGVIEGEIVDLDSIRKLAALPSRQELRGMLAGTLQAPLRNLAGTLHALLGHLRNALDARQQQLDGVNTEDPAPAPPSPPAP